LRGLSWGGKWGGESSLEALKKERQGCWGKVSERERKREERAERRKRERREERERGRQLTRERWGGSKRRQNKDKKNRGC
jgi:hypothetical protein